MTSQKEYYDTLPKKHMAAGALFFNEEGHLLLIKPSYKDHWSIPGGVVDAEESPLAACRREILEEISLDAPNLSFLCVDYKAPEEPGRDSLQFIFHGGRLTPEKISGILLDGKEIVEFKFLPPEEALLLFNRHLRSRVAQGLLALRAGKACYLENGEFAA